MKRTFDQQAAQSEPCASFAWRQPMHAAEREIGRAGQNPQGRRARAESCAGKNRRQAPPKLRRFSSGEAPASVMAGRPAFGGDGLAQMLPQASTTLPPLALMAAAPIRSTGAISRRLLRS